MKENILKRHKFNLKNGDVVTSSLKCYASDNLLEKYSKDIKLEIGKDEFLKGFDNLLINHLKKFGLKKDFYILVKPNGANLEDDSLQNQSLKFEFSNFKVESKDKQPEEAKKTCKNEEKLKELTEKIAKLEQNLAMEQYKNITEQMTFKNKVKELEASLSEKLQSALEEKTKHLESQFEDNKKFVLQKFLDALMDPFNNFVMATNAGKNSDNEIVKNYCYGFDIVKKQFIDALERNSANIINPELNSKFDANWMQIIDTQEDASKEDETILRVARLGISLNNRLITPAQVVVVKNKK
ncbi:nucleotide exchange factor GrpE [Mycoplasmopsis synoviae]|uniref:Protein GrpE n=1 Tax=Mycoplasmopsis synoviae (strain 53) TaxID=262723 RepID=Q4A657_MYCS5|nr:nucleotide exchange factor GrpE [Mycoplasmopsis synoviae]AAZ43764.2 heat shock protein GrpE [Mycoplasmopsis synoviae 53]